MNAALDSPSNRETGDYRRLDIGQIEPYDRNPRQLPNPKTRDLEASLRASGGLDRVLAVTQRPGAHAYMVLEGGNTTLILLKKLLSETNDECFRFVTADIRPWPGDLDVMARHYRENNTRGDLSFGERSLEMLALYQQYCEEAAPADSRPTVAKFCSYLAKRFGIPCVPSNFSLYKFTAEPLAEAMPFLVRRTRFTKAQAVAIRGRYNKIKAVWCDKNAGTRDEFDEAFFGLLARQDKALEKTFAREIADDPSSLPDIAYNDDELISGLQNEFARSEAIDCSYAQAGVWISAALHGGPKIVPRETLQAEGDYFFGSDVSASPQKRPALTDIHPTIKTQTFETKDQPGNRHDATEIALAYPVRPDPLAPHPLSPPKDGDDVFVLRSKAYAYASRIALRNGLQDVVVALPDSGFGYILVEVHDDLMQAARTVSPSVAAWWALAAGCALSMTPEAVRDRVMPEDSFLRTALDQGNIALLAQGYPFQSFDQSGRFWDALKAKDWSDFLAIQKLFKAMTVAARGLHNLWSL